jgi:hypothetical protein
MLVGDYVYAQAYVLQLVKDPVLLYDRSVSIDLPRTEERPLAASMIPNEWGHVNIANFMVGQSLWAVRRYMRDRKPLDTGLQRVLLRTAVQLDHGKRVLRRLAKLGDEHPEPWCTPSGSKEPEASACLQ